MFNILTEANNLTLLNFLTEVSAYQSSLLIQVCYKGFLDLWDRVAS